MSRFLLFILVLSALESKSQSISVSGTWYPSISASNITEAGSDYAAGYNVSSNANQSLVAITMPGSGFFNVLDNWRVDISKSDLTWNSSLILEVQRTGNGTGTRWWFWSSSITGGTGYQTISNLPSPFFSGNGNYTNIPMRYKLSGLSVLIPVGTYTTNVVYTLIDI